MCLRNLFCGGDCTWLLFIIVLILLADNRDCDNGCGVANSGCGCGCSSCGKDCAQRKE